jgi:hypothetical protein
MNRMRWAIIALGVLATAVLVPMASAQGGNARIIATAVKADRNGDDAIKVDVLVAGASDVGAFEVMLTYSDDTLELRDEQTSLERGPFLGSSGREVFCPEPTITPGRVRYACVTLGAEPLEGAAGDGLLVSVYFFEKKDAKGERRIALESGSLSRPIGESLPVEAETGDIALPKNGGSNTVWFIIGGAGAAAVVVAAGAAAMMLRQRSAGVPASGSE